MKKKMLTTVCCSLLLSVSSIAYCAGGAYISGNAGISVPNDADVTDSTAPGVTLDLQSDNGLALGLAAGYGFANNTRLEAELAYQKNDLDKAAWRGNERNLTGDTSSTALLINGYYDFVNKSPMTPFISAGAGLARVDINDMNVVGSGIPNTNEDDTVFAYQIGAGVGFAVSPKVNLDLKYRYLGTSDPEFGTADAEYSSHNVYAGVRVSL